MSKLWDKKQRLKALRAKQEPTIEEVRTGKLQAKMTLRNGDAGEVLKHSEINRICNLPFMVDMTKEQYEWYCRENILAEAYADGFRFFPKQAQAMLSFELFKGLVAPIGVGFGKTLVTLLCANKAYAWGTKKILGTALLGNRICSIQFRLCYRTNNWRLHKTAYKSS